MLPGPMNRIRSERASVSVQPSPAFDVDALLRRFSNPSPYTPLNPATNPSPMQTAAEPSSQEHVVPPSRIPFDTAHEYLLASRGRDYAIVAVVSHAQNVRDPPLLHFGDELNGVIVLPRENLTDMRSMEVVFQLFESDPIIPSYENKQTLLSQQVDESCISGGQFNWPFVFTPPPVLSSTAVSGYGDSSPTHLSPRGHRSRPKVQLVVTIYRRGRLTRNVGLRQPIHYVPPPDPVLTSSPSLLSTELPSTSSGESPGLAVDSSWPQQKCPKVVVRGIIFRRLQVDVECKLIVPVSHPVSDAIPLRLVMTCVSREALELLAVSHAIDVRLLKVLVFGGNIANIHPFTLRNRSSYHRTDWAARAQWEANAPPWEVPPSDEHPEARWRIKLNGTLHRVPKIEITESFEQRGTGLMYFVSLFPFRSSDFRPASDPNKELFMAKLPITRQR
ncbi:hypothetical protein H4582DRAFT_2075191 [Lactarius indigo]|nr:hypothetical protein H4582DRAFT_2075191 [Lactarius indigo]